jgi:hypothetical protein
MILVDTPHGYPNGPRHLRNARWCHMVSDTSLEELHAFAMRLGLKRAWFQDGRTPHYDLVEAKRAVAVGMGAREVSDRELVRIARELREGMDR